MEDATNRQIVELQRLLWHAGAASMQWSRIKKPELLLHRTKTAKYTKVKNFKSKLPISDKQLTVSSCVVAQDYEHALLNPDRASLGQLKRQKKLLKILRAMVADIEDEIHNLRQQESSG